MSDEIKTPYNYNMPLRIRAKLEKVAMKEGIPINQILDDLVDKAYPDSQVSPGISSLIPPRK